MSRRLVIGLGNPLAGDDGFGPAVVRRLLEEGLPPDVTTIPVCSDLLTQIDCLEAHETIVLVDAVTGGTVYPGTVEALEEAGLLGWEARSTSAHRLSPVEALRVFRVLCPQATTRIVLVALHTATIGPERVHLHAGTIEEGAGLVRALLYNDGVTDRAHWPVRRFPLGAQPGDDLSATTTPAERVAMVWTLTLEAWSVAGRPLPDYRREDTPVRVLRRA